MASNHDCSPDVPFYIDVEGGNKPIDTHFEPDNDVDDVTITWDCIQAWNSASEEELSSTSDSDIDTDDEEEDDNPNIELSTSSELVTAHGLCFTPSDYAETKLLKL
jgi:hypothetical protein